MNGHYLEIQVRTRVVGPIIAFREYIFRDVLPAFGHLQERADQVAEEYYNLIGSVPAGEDCDIDMASVADAAQDRSLSWYEMMTSLRQTMRNLLAAGLFHLTEQQLATLCRDAGFTMGPPRDSGLSAVKQWYSQHLRLEFESLPSWTMIHELRLLANTVKHGEGRSAEELKTLRPQLFSNPDYEEIYKEFREHGMEPCIGPVAAPLAGEDLFVSDVLLQKYAECAESFFCEIAAHFKAHGNEHY